MKKKQKKWCLKLENIPDDIRNTLINEGKRHHLPQGRYIEQVLIEKAIEINNNKQSYGNCRNKMVRESSIKNDKEKIQTLINALNVIINE